MNTQIVKVDETKLDEVVKTSGLPIEQGEESKKAYLPFLIQLAEIQEQSSKINFANPTGIDETIARELRLKTVKIRTGSKDLKDERKRIYLLRGNLEQAAYNLIAASCELAEEEFVKVEKAREIAEKKRLAELKIERIALLAEFTETPELFQSELLSEEAFKQLLEGQKLAKAADAAKKIADELAAKEAAELKAKQEAELAAKKAASAPLKAKVTVWIDGLVMPELGNDATVADIRAKFEGFKSWAKTQLTNL